MPRRAREELSRIFSKVIRARRASGAREDDILQCFIDSRYEKARRLSSLGFRFEGRADHVFVVGAVLQLSICA